jgi:hypothetical protein
VFANVGQRLILLAEFEGAIGFLGLAQQQGADGLF